MNTIPRIIVIGSGPAGLGVGWRLHELGHDDFVVYEKNRYVGGLATSFVDTNGFTWDVGGHVIHSHYPYFDNMFSAVMQKDFFTHERESWVWIFDRFVPYPFQNNIHRLPKRSMDECMDGLMQVSNLKASSAQNFREWIAATYGDGIAKYFMYPYNEKVWAYPLDKMGVQWMADRVAPIDIKRIKQNILSSSDDVSWGPNAVFHYPKFGGTGEIWRRVAKQFADHIVCDKEVMRIDAKKRTVHFSDGTNDIYDILFTTMPLDHLVKITDGIHLTHVQKALHHSSVAVVGIGMEGCVPEKLSTKCWMYFPEHIAPFFRATVLSNYSPHNAPKGAWSLMMEVSSSRYRPVSTSDIVQATLTGAKQVKLIASNAKIVSRWSFRAPYGYPTPTITRDRYVDPTLQQFEKYGIYSRGRFGAWKYEISNQDHTFMQGVEWVDSRAMS